MILSNILIVLLFDWYEWDKMCLVWKECIHNFYLVVIITKILNQVNDDVVFIFLTKFKLTKLILIYINI